MLKTVGLFNIFVETIFDEWKVQKNNIYVKYSSLLSLGIHFIQ